MQGSAASAPAPPPAIVPESFYYFTALNTDDRKHWLEENLLENRVFFPSREQLNELNELRPEIIFDGPEKKLRRYVHELFLEHSPIRLSPARRVREVARLMFHYRNRPEFAREIIHEILGRVGILCLSGTNLSELLWSHYADGHRGVCVEFDPSVGLFNAAQRVTYTDEPPVINQLVDSVDQKLTKSMFTKRAAWLYEEEWRVIARWRDEERIARYFAQHRVPEAIAQFMRDQHGPGYYSFPAEALRSVILDARVAPEIEAWLREIVARTPGPLPIRRATVTRDRQIAVA